MSATATAPAPAVQQQQESKALTLRQQLESDAFKSSISKVLPKHITPERMARVAVTALTRTPKLKDCEQISFFRCLMDLSQWGLEPDGRRAHLIPFENRKRGVIECQLIIDYKGLVELCYRAGVVKVIHADVVREGDIFRYSLGQVIEHVPHFLRRDANKPKEAGEVYAVYCHVGLAGDVVKTEVLSRDEVEAIRRRSRAGSNGPWVTDWNEMAKKTAFRRVSKWLPLSADFRDAVEGDDDTLVDGAFIQPAKPVSSLNDLTERLMGGVAEDGSNVIDADQDDDTEETTESLSTANPTYAAWAKMFADCNTEKQVDELARKLMPEWQGAEDDEETQRLAKVAKERIKAAKK